MNIWKEFGGVNFRKPLDSEPWRMVESQYISSSRDLVDSMEEHELLEALLEKSKPQI